MCVYNCIQVILSVLSKNTSFLIIFCLIFPHDLYETQAEKPELPPLEMISMASESFSLETFTLEASDRRWRIFSLKKPGKMGVEPYECLKFYWRKKTKHQRWDIFWCFRFCCCCLLLLVVGCWLLVIVGCWLLVVGCWLLVVGCWLLVVGCWLLVVGCWLLVVGCWLVDIWKSSLSGGNEFQIAFPSFC